MDSNSIINVISKYTSDPIRLESRLNEDLGISSFYMMLIMGEIEKKYASF
jgi:acyl carrier protein